MAYSFGSIRPMGLGEKLWRVQWPLLIVAAAIAAIGTAALYSVAGGSFQPWAERHAMRFLIATLIVVIMAMVRPEVWLKAAYPLYAVVLILLALVPVYGVEALGARRWIGTGAFSFQPSEIMKVALVLALARYYQWLPPGKVSNPAAVLVPLAMIVVPVVLTLRQPDLGTAVLFAAVGLSLMYFASTPLWYFLAGIGAAAAASPFVWANLHDYQRRRIEIFLRPERDPLGSGYHIAQSKIAIGSGGLSGKGLMHGTQSQLDFVPEKHTDFVLTLLGEEWGFVGLMILIGLYGLMLALMFSMAFRCRSNFSRLVVAGAAVVIFVYAFINIAMVTGLVPVVGIPLPLVSYGGTSMMTLMVLIGLAMSAYVHGRETIRRDEIGAFW
jgi:rod shape determining protein RodA